MLSAKLKVEVARDVIAGLARVHGLREKQKLYDGKVPGSENPTDTSTIV